jgi:hypothetical protein
MGIAGKEISITRIENNTIFIKQKEVILTSDEWKIVINLDLDTYEEIVARLRLELKHIHKAKTEFAPINELLQVENLLNKLEDAVISFREILPRVEAKRSILNAAGSVFKFLFGTATMADISNLHNTVQDLHHKQDEIVHSVNDQLTYLKSLDTTVKFDTKAVDILSGKIKSIMLESAKWTNKVDMTTQWLNATIFNQTSIFTYIRQLELEVLELKMRVKDILHGVEQSLSGRLSLSLIPPDVLLGILRNVTFVLPDGYSLIVGLHRNNMHYYYEYSSIAIMVHHHSMRLIVSIPLKTSDRLFNIYKVFTLPYKIAELNKYVQMIINFPYLVSDSAGQRFLLWTDADVEKCRGKDFIICPADSPLFNNYLSTCESSLFFQNHAARHMCNRKVMSSFTPMFTRVHTSWIYSVAEPQHVKIQCRLNNTWTTASLILEGNGVIHNSSSCHIVGQGFQLLPTSRGYSEVILPTHENMIIQHVEPLHTAEVSILKHKATIDVETLNELSAEANKLLHQDVNTLIRLKENHIRQHESQYSFLYILIGIILLTLITVFFCYGKPWLYTWIISKIIRDPKKNHYPIRKPESNPSNILDKNNAEPEVENATTSEDADVQHNAELFVKHRATSLE